MGAPSPASNVSDDDSMLCEVGGNTNFPSAPDLSSFHGTPRYTVDMAEGAEFIARDHEHLAREPVHISGPITPTQAYNPASLMGTASVSFSPVLGETFVQSSAVMPSHSAEDKDIVEMFSLTGSNSTPIIGEHGSAADNSKNVVGPHDREASMGNSAAMRQLLSTSAYALANGVAEGAQISALSEESGSSDGEDGEEERGGVCDKDDSLGSVTSASAQEKKRRAKKTEKKRRSSEAPEGPPTKRPREERF